MNKPHVCGDSPELSLFAFMLLPTFDRVCRTSFLLESVRNVFCFQSQVKGLDDNFTQRAFHDDTEKKKKKKKKKKRIHKRASVKTDHQNQSAAGAGGQGIRIVFYCQQVSISVSSKLSVRYYHGSR